MGISVSSAERSESSLGQADTPEISGAAVHSMAQRERQDAAFSKTPREVSQSDQARAGCWEASHSLTWSRVRDVESAGLYLICN